MALKLDLERRARDFLDGLPAKQFRQVAVRLFDLLRDPDAPDTSVLKNSPYRRADVREYRIVYRVAGDVLVVPLIGGSRSGAVDFVSDNNSNNDAGNNFQ